MSTLKIFKLRELFGPRGDRHSLSGMPEIHLLTHPVRLQVCLLENHGKAAIKLFKISAILAFLANPEISRSLGVGGEERSSSLGQTPASRVLLFWLSACR